MVCHALSASRADDPEKSIGTTKDAKCAKARSRLSSPYELLSAALSVRRMANAQSGKGTENRGNSLLFAPFACFVVAQPTLPG